MGSWKAGARSVLVLLLVACGGDGATPVCKTDGDCKGGLVCHEGVCDAAADEGEPCRSDGSCADDHTARIQTPLGPKVVSLTCNAERRCEFRGTEGARCAAGACNSAALLFCNAEDVCEPRRDQGEPCQWSRECLRGKCTAAGKCGDFEAGDPCEEQDTLSCGPYLSCVDDVCIEGGSVAEGGRCLADGHCASSMCIDETCQVDPCEGVICLGNRWCSNGACRFPAGEPCEGDHDCHSDGGCGPALDGTMRCLENVGHICNTLTFNGDFYNPCVDACETQCTACKWTLVPGQQVAECVASCAPGETECYDHD
jgi:hypothetical protein